MKCIQNQILKRTVGLVLSDTLSTPIGGQKNGEEIDPQNGDNFCTETGIIFVPASKSKSGRCHQSKSCQ